MKRLQSGAEVLVEELVLDRGGLRAPLFGELGEGIVELPGVTEALPLESTERGGPLIGESVPEPSPLILIALAVSFVRRWRSRIP